MPTARHGDVSLFYDREGDGDPVVFVGDTGYGAWQWGWQHGAVAGPYESLVTELRGTGRSDAPPGPYSVPDLAGDLDAILADAGVGGAHVVGAGLGGMVALEAARSSSPSASRIRSLVLVGSAATGDGIDLGSLYADPSDEDGLRGSLDPALSATFFREQAGAVERILAWRAAEDAERAAWEAQAAAVDAFDASDWLVEVTQPTLVLHGTADAVWPAERGRELAEDLPRGEFVGVEGAGHLAHVEHSRVVNDHLLGFLDRVTDDDG
ncbi:alpha/beta fold hydrolase [Halobium salinum]|uniref:Alpha/beta fold hydrolase n=1 Tax=Halobium salinum TaxID=1364940 RepID=A0ABD5P7Z9_9EURY|nr:alpha/beta fold hydrolase [Halobium salinum]